VLFLYGALGVAVGLLWLLFGREPHQAGSTTVHPGAVPIRQALSQLILNKALWLIGLTIMFRSGCITGMIGYLPLYLRERGLTAASADNALASFFAASTIFVVPLSSLSDRLGSRKAILFPALLATTVCVGVLPLAQGITVWILMILAGIFFDGFMAVICTMLLETDGVGLAYSGTALGLVFTISQIVGVFTPPLGNSLGGVNPGLPFYFWAAISAVALITLAFCKETGQRRLR